MTSDAKQMLLPHEQEKVAIRALYDQIMEVWNRGSGEGFAAPFADVGEQVAFDGTRFAERREIAELHQILFNRFLRGGRLAGKATDVCFLAPDIALAHAIGGTVMAGASDVAPDRNSVQTLVEIRHRGAWRVANLHNSRAAFMGRPDAAAAFAAESRALVQDRRSRSPADRPVANAHGPSACATLFRAMGNGQWAMGNDRAMGFGLLDGGPLVEEWQHA